MLPLKFTATIVILAVCALPSFAKPSDELEIKAVFKTAEQAFRTLDFDMLARVCTPDYVEINQGKKTGLDVIKKGMAQMKQVSSKVKKVSLTVTKLTISGNRAVALGDSQNEIEIKNPDTGRPVTLGVISKNRFSLVKIAGKWKISKLDRLEQKRTMDGKPMPITGAAPKK